MGNSINKKDCFSVKFAFKKIVPTQILISFNYFLPFLICSLLAGKFIGTTAQAAISYSEFLNYILTSFAGIVSIGCSILEGQSTGKGNSKKSNSIFSTAVIFALTLGIIFTIFIFFNLDFLADILQVEELAVNDFKGYLSGWCFIGAPLMLLFVLLTYLQIYSQNKGIFIFMGLLVVMGLGLGKLLIGSLSLGSFGIGLTLSISMFLSDIFLVIWLIANCKNIKFSFKSFSFKLIKDITITGSPFAIANMCFSIKAIIRNYIAQTLGGVNALAAINILFSLATIPESISMGLSNSVILIASVYIGEKNKEKLYTLLSYALKFSLLITSFLSILWIATCYLGCGIFTNDKEILNLSYWACLLYTPSVILYVVPDTMIKLYQSLGRIRLANILYLLYSFIIPVSIMYACIPIAGLNAVWLPYTLTDIVTITFLFFLCFYKKKHLPRNTADALWLQKNYFNGEIVTLSTTSKNEIIDSSIQIYNFLKDKNLPIVLTKMIALACEELGIDILCNNCSKKRLKNCVIEFTLLLGKDNIILHVTDNADKFNPIIYSKVMDSDNINYHFGMRYIIKNCNNATYINALSLNNYHLTYNYKQEKKGM